MPDDEWVPARCPRCSSVELCLTEVWRSYVRLHQEADGTLETDPLLNLDPGDATGRIEARCLRCRHEWKLRGFRQFL